MDSLVGYGSDDDHENERYPGPHSSGTGGAGSSRRRDDDTNYDEVNMELSEDSQAESEPELPPAEPVPPRQAPRDDRRGSDDRRDREHDRNDRLLDRHDRSLDRRDRRRESPPRPRSRSRSDRRSPRRDEKHNKCDRPERSRGGHEGSSKRGLLGDRPDDRSADSKVPALMELKSFGGANPSSSHKSQDARDAVSPRFVDRSDRREKDRDRERDRDRHNRRSEERRSGSRHREHRSDRSRSRGATFVPATVSHSSSSSEKRGSPPSGDYRPSSYKVNKKLEVMEKMGLQIKTPDGSMATAQQLRAAAGDAPAHSAGGGLPSYYNPCAVNTSKILDQVQKRKLLWSNKNKTEAEEAAKWSGTRFAQDNDGKQVSKFMRLMGIKEPAAVKPEPQTVDPIKKQEELFQAMQAQYEVARATTHTMRGVGLGFQRGQF